MRKSVVIVLLVFQIALVNWHVIEASDDIWGGEPETDTWGGEHDTWGGEHETDHWGGEHETENSNNDTEPVYEPSHQEYQDYQPQHTKYDPNYDIMVPVYYDANTFDPNDPLLHKVYIDSFSNTNINRSCHNENITCNTSSPYRTMDGTCNNLGNPIWGASHTAQERMLDPQFEEETEPQYNVPRNHGLPTARELSNECFSAEHNQHFSTKHTTTMVWFGQLIVHDIVLTQQHKEPEDCCNETSHNDPRCFNIGVPSWDYFYISHCLPFWRSLTTTRGCLPDPNANDEDAAISLLLSASLYAEINNGQSSFIDGSVIYGPTLNESIELRELEGGRLKVKEAPNGTMLPENNAECPMQKQHEYCYCQQCGDPRCNDIPYLGASALLFIRLHNWIADGLAALNNIGWDDEILYQEARKIVIALLQLITYNEYLPELLGEHVIKNNLLTINLTSPFNDEYDGSVNPGIFVEVASAAMRMGHSMIPPQQAYLLPGHCLMDWYTVIETFGSTCILYANNGSKLPEYARWMTWDKCMKSDSAVEDEFRVWLNGEEDLVSRNIQRGRDHGVRNYNEFREFCGLAPVSFDDYVLLDHSFESSEKLRALYRHAGDIDLYVGASGEKPSAGSLLGPTFTCLIAKQFRQLRISDRFWFEIPGVFTEDQLNNIKTMKLSCIVCMMYELETVQTNVFQLAYYTHENPLVNCSSCDTLNFNLWTTPS